MYLMTLVVLKRWKQGRKQCPATPDRLDDETNEMKWFRPAEAYSKKPKRKALTFNIGLRDRSDVEDTGSLSKEPWVQTRL